MTVFMDKDTYKHIVEIDHWEKDELGYCYMVDVHGRKWWGEHYRGSNHYSLDLEHIYKDRKVVRKMKQNNKYMVFITYKTEDLNKAGYTDGWTVNKQTMLDEYFLLNIKIAEDSINTLLEALLK